MMLTFTVLKFSTGVGAEIALETLKRLQQQQLITLHDAAIVTWPRGARKPKTKHLAHLAREGALDGAFWGFLFGLIFFVPFLGAAVGAAVGGLLGHLSGGSIDEAFIGQMRQSLTEGTSALFLLTSHEVVDKVTDALQGMGLEVVTTNLSKEAEAQLRAIFAEDNETGS
jgi:uncharacterized membrane protein